jgi:hypothetical protein
LNFFEEFLFWGPSPSSAGCFKKPTQIPNAGHPICVFLIGGILVFAMKNTCQQIEALIHLEAFLQEAKNTLLICEEHQVFFLFLVINYYTFSNSSTLVSTVGGGPPGYDYRRNEKIDLTANGTYSSVSN